MSLNIIDLPLSSQGCGIGGIATAARLGKAGFDVTIYEKVGGGWSAYDGVKGTDY